MGAHSVGWVSALSRAGAAELNDTINLLRALEYIGHDDQLTIKGRLLRSIFHPAGILWAELIEGVALEELHPAEMAELASWFAFDDERSVRNHSTLSPRLALLRIGGSHGQTIISGRHDARTATRRRP